MTEADARPYVALASSKVHNSACKGGLIRSEGSTLEGRATTFSACACAVKERKATAVSTARRGVNEASSIAAQHRTMAASDSSTAVLYMIVAVGRFSSAS